MMLSDVCLSVTYIGPKWRTERPRKTKIGTVVAHVTRDSDTTFKVKMSKHHQAALLTAALTRQAAAAVSVVGIGRGNLLLRCGLHFAGAVGSGRGASAPTEGGEWRGILWRPPAYSLLVNVASARCRGETGDG